MNKEILKAWKPLPDIPKEMHVEGLHDDWERFRILMRGKSISMLRILVPSLMAYRNIDESYRLRQTFEVIADADTCLFTIENSIFLKQFQEESCNVFDNWDIVHYAIFTEGDCIDFLTTEEPIVEWLDADYLSSDDE